MIVVARDAEGLRLAALELLKEPMVEEFNQGVIKAAAGAENYKRVLQDVTPTRTLSDGYYTRVEYLFGIRRQLKSLLLDSTKLSADDVTGLLAIDEAIDEFAREHWRCVKCQRYSPNDAEACRCGFDPKKGRA